MIVDSVNNDVRGVSCKLPFSSIGGQKGYCVSFAGDAKSTIQLFAVLKSEILATRETSTVKAMLPS